MDFELARTSAGKEKGGMGAALHERAEHHWRIEILSAVHEDCTKGHSFGEFGVEFENRLARFLFGPAILAESKIG